jgi:Photosynthetic reaction centre cytochrome C subunit
MHQYEADLGVECGFCHARNPETKRNDFASDANPLKNTARIMIKMTSDLNAKYLTQLSGDHKSDDPITCGTCHRGMSHPAVFVPKPHDHDQPHDHESPTSHPPSP